MVDQARRNDVGKVATHEPTLNDEKLTSSMQLTEAFSSANILVFILNQGKLIIP